ncbi:beta-1,3-galactosyl-O-glycosyl-glycoprotein beta-1,6-N-acetylglucosaminyltransferase-like [Nelusetta ayraudi]|uniref:beta-1,3-galactosyl-O-glycosyl-glycoprotein beta-1,6-N-acetylglucosaminyltransferase-like n=1 Tax=Nelusetta ayraudi TaxID=303726 RepID=UPI003F716D33
MKSVRCISLELLLLLTVVAGALWIVMQVTRHQSSWNPSNIFNYGWLDDTNDDGGPELACDCFAVLQGNALETDKAKILTVTKEFRKRVQVQNFEHLLRAIYAPQNVYCVHVDTKSAASVRAAIEGIVSCFPNVFLVSQPVRVVYGSWSRVQADLNCMADLYNSTTTWKYFINLCGQDFPLKTNLEIVRMLKSLRGDNSMESEKMPGGKIWRVTNVFQVVDGEIKRTGKKKDPPPFNLPILSGKAYIVASRGYVHSVLNDLRIQKLIEWANDTYSPDEFLWATIQRLPGIPGSKWPSQKYDMTDINAIARLVKWQEQEGQQGSLDAVYPECQGNHVRSICVYGVGDLYWLLQHNHLFANKFDMDSDPVAVFCLEKYLRLKALAMIH